MIMVLEELETCSNCEEEDPASLGLKQKSPSSKRHSLVMKCQSWKNHLKQIDCLRRAPASQHFPRLRSSTTAPNHGRRTPSESKSYLQVGW